MLSSGEHKSNQVLVSTPKFSFWPQSTVARSEVALPISLPLHKMKARSFAQFLECSSVG